MSKQAKAKEEQGYDPKPVPRICSTCMHFSSRKEKLVHEFGTYTQEKDIRCSIGGFAIKKTAACRLHQFPNPIHNNTSEV